MQSVKVSISDENMLSGFCEKHPKNHYTANSESVNGMIHNKDTIAFAKKNHLQILKILEGFESKCNQLKKQA